MKRKRLVILSPYPPGIAPGPRFRFEQYLSALNAEGFHIEYLSFLDEKTQKALYSEGQTFKKLLGVLKGYIRRFFHFFKALKADRVFIYREATPLGYPYIEMLLAAAGKKIIYDFDDAIWIPAVSEANSLAAKLKYPEKVSMICKKAYRLSVGNAFLQAKALEFRGNSSDESVRYIPTTIDTENHHNFLKSHHDTKMPVIGWTGSHSTLPYLAIVFPVLAELEKEYEFRFQVICNRKPDFELKSLEFVEWSHKDEIKDLAEFDIGLMPLTASEWSAGKCGFKALQYMALGIPALVSPVGVNSEIVENGIHGYHCESSEDWKSALLKLLNAPKLRSELGRAGREKTENKFSVKSNTEAFLGLFD